MAENNSTIDKAYNLKNKNYIDKKKSELPRGAEKYENENGDLINVKSPNLPKSIINDYNLFRLKNINGDNYPLTDEELGNRKDLLREPTANELISNPIGASVYKPEDFLFVENYGKIPNSHMITLRRFAYPCVDDIFSDYQQEPDISRLLTYATDEENKLSELLSFSCGVNWKELESSFEQMHMHGDQSGVSDGYLKNILKFVDPTFGKNALAGETKLNFDPKHDGNKVYGPVDSITKTHIRDVGVNFEQEFQLTFKYRTRSFNGVNQKAVFTDILSNMMLMSTVDAKFWGGARYWVGARPTKYLKNLRMLSPESFDDFMNKSNSAFKSFLGSFSGEGGSIKDKLLNLGKNAFNLGFGKILNKVGRPSIPYMDSLLTNVPVGEYHITIGNPLNPILTVGDLIMTNCEFKTGDVLNIDGIPEELQIVVTLKHSKPRGRAEIENMWNSGMGRTYFKPKELFDDITTTKQNPKSSASILDKTFIGSFDKDSVLRNADAIWSFLKK